MSLNFSNTFSLSGLSGGAMLYLENIDNGIVNSAVIKGESHDVSLPNGNWKFTVVGWDGSSPLNGNLNCGSVAVNLNGDPKVIDLAISEARCDSDEFIPSSYRLSAVPFPIDIITCRSVAAITGGGQDCDNAAKGLSGSYRVRMTEYAPSTLNSIGHTDGGLVSSCELAPGSTNSVFNSSFKLPLGRPDGLFAVAIDSFTDSSCLSGRKTYFFPRGLSTPVNNTKVFSNAANRIRAFVLHGGVGFGGVTNFGKTINPAPVNGLIDIVNNSGDTMYIDGAIFSAAAPFKFTGTGGPYPGTSGTCSTSLADNSTCSLDVEFFGTTLNFKLWPSDFA